MEGLAAEAIKHSIDEAPKKGAVLDAAIIAQFQRMTHYGIIGFGAPTRTSMWSSRKTSRRCPTGTSPIPHRASPGSSRHRRAAPRNGAQYYLSLKAKF